MWPRESVDALTERLSRQAPVERVTEPVSAVEVGAAYPGALNPIQARPILFSVEFATLLLAAVVLGTYLVVGR